MEWVCSRSPCGSEEVAEPAASPGSSPVTDDVRLWQEVKRY